MVNNFIENIFLSWVFGALIWVVLEWSISLNIFSSAGCLERWSATCTTQLMSTRPRWVLSAENWKYILFTIFWRMKSDLSSLFTRMSRLGVSFLPKPHTQFVSRNGTEVSQKTISADRQTSCKDLYLDYQGRGKLSDTHLRWALFTCAVSAWTATSQLSSRLTTTTTWTPGSRPFVQSTIVMKNYFQISTFSDPSLIIA